jgi:hypothetical protein
MVLTALSESRFGSENGPFSLSPHSKKRWGNVGSHFPLSLLRLWITWDRFCRAYPCHCYSRKTVLFRSQFQVQVPFLQVLFTWKAGAQVTCLYHL